MKLWRLTLAFYPGIPLRSDKKEKVVESCVRFSEKERGHPTVEVTDTVFSVNRAIQLHGVTIYGGTGGQYKYTLSILAVSVLPRHVTGHVIGVLYSHVTVGRDIGTLISVQGETVLGSKEGTYTQSDYHGDGMVNLLLKDHVKLEVHTYTVHLEEVHNNWKPGDFQGHL